MARRARVARGLTQADIAERVGIATEVYGRLERGKMLPSVATLQRLSVVLRVSADSLLGLDGPSLPAVREQHEPYRADDRLRPLVRKLKQLNGSQLRLLGQVAAALGKSTGAAPRRPRGR